jgi:hypothetical protein
MSVVIALAGGTLLGVGLSAICVRAVLGAVPKKQ